MWNINCKNLRTTFFYKRENFKKVKTYSQSATVSNENELDWSDFLDDNLRLGLRTNLVPKSLVSSGNSFSLSDFAFMFLSATQFASFGALTTSCSAGGRLKECLWKTLFSFHIYQSDVKLCKCCAVVLRRLSTSDIFSWKKIFIISPVYYLDRYII